MLIRTLIALSSLALAGVPACLQLSEAAAPDASDALSSDASGGDVAVTAGALSLGPGAAPATASPLAAVHAAHANGAAALWIPRTAAASIMDFSTDVTRWAAVFEARHLASQHAASATAAPPVPEGWFAIVHDGDLVLANEAPEAWWGGPAAFVRRGEVAGRFVVERAAREEALPAALVGWLGRDVRLLDRRGERCVARVDGFALRSELIDNNLALWGDENPWNEAAPDRLAQDPDVAWEDGGRMLLGTLTTVRGDCSGAIVAVAVARAAPTPLARVATDRKLVAQALAAFRALPAWAAAQAEYREQLAAQNEVRAAATWDRYAGGRPTVERFRNAQGREVVLVTVNTSEGCGSPGSQLSAVFEVARSHGQATLTPVYGQRWAAELTSFVDLDGDGSLEGIGAGAPAAVRTLTPDDAPVRRAADIPDRTDYGCPC